MRECLDWVKDNAYDIGLGIGFAGVPIAGVGMTLFTNYNKLGWGLAVGSVITTRILKTVYDNYEHRRGQERLDQKFGGVTADEKIQRKKIRDRNK